MKKASTCIYYLLVFLSLIIFFSVLWVKDTFGLVSLDSLIFHLNVPLKGTESGMIYKFLYGPLLKSVIVFFIFIIVFRKKNYYYGLSLDIRLFRIRKSVDLVDVLSKFKLLNAFIMVILSLSFFAIDFNVLDYVKSLSRYSSFIENNYVEPENTKIAFEEKRNLIHIYVESLEFTYASVNNGGVFENDLMPHLSNYATNEISFRNSLGGGFYNSRATGWTIAGMVAQTSGIGFLVPDIGNDMGKYSKFLPGAYSIGEVLEKEGYNQVLLIGSDGDFAGRNVYFSQHGNYEIKDYKYAIDNGWIDSDYYVWWGYEDSKLYDFAKKELIELSNKKQPFNLTLLTTNTHHIGGYLEDSCEIKYDDQFKNVISCSDKQIYELIEWIKKQDFYKNTTIVITGDHLSMDPHFFNNIGSYERTNYNVFINSKIKTTNTKNRLFYNMDMYPTILASLGAKIDGDRLALGTNLFSEKKTLYEEYGKDNVENNFKRNSMYFKNHIIYGK